MTYNFQEILEQWPPAIDPWSMSENEWNNNCEVEDQTDVHNECEGNETNTGTVNDTDRDTLADFWRSDSDSDSDSEETVGLSRP